MSEKIDEAVADGMTEADFDAGWNSAMGEEAPAAEPTEEAPVEEAPVEEPPAEEAPTEEPPAEEAHVEDDYAARMQRIEEMLAKQNAKPEPQPEPAKEEPILTEQEIAALDEFANEWPDVNAAINTILKRERAEIYRRVAESIAPVIDPLVQNYQSTAADQHYNQLVSAHPDYDIIRDKVVDWIDKQPAFLKNAYMEVAQNGATQDVIELLNRYKAENNLTNVASTLQNQPASSKEPSEKAKKAAASLGVVESKRSIIPVTDTKDDFDAAWEQAIKMT